MGKTIGEYGEMEIIIQKSRFICQAKRVETEAAAQQFIVATKKQYWDATHNCYAYVITDQIQKSSDDGEPAGTAGRPILEIIHNKKLTQTAIIITRYYGGIKLGTGGLVRAYSQGALEAVNASGVFEKNLYQQLCLSFDYTFLGRLEHELRILPILLDEPEYKEKIYWSLWSPINKVEEYDTQIKNWTNGQVEITLGETEEKIVKQ
jgi:uncharacterized YigZ family protein